MYAINILLCIEGVLRCDAKRLLLANVSSSSPPHHRRGRCPMSAHSSEAAVVRGRGGTPHDIGTDPSAHSQQYILHCIVCIYTIFVKLMEREGQRVDSGRSLKGLLYQSCTEEWFWPNTEDRRSSFMKNFRIPKTEDLRSSKISEYRRPKIFVHEKFPKTEDRRSSFLK